MRRNGYIVSTPRDFASGVAEPVAEVNLRRCVKPLRCGRRRLTSGRTQWPRISMVSLFQALMIILNVIWFIMIAHIIMSWLLNFQVLNIRQPMVAQVWYGLNRLLEPIYAPIRRFLPQTPGLDLAPLVAFVVLIILQRVLINNAGFFYGY
jgi:YggT family protein